MTINEKRKIQELRIRGMGYGEVAKRMEMNLNTVKSFCRRNGLRDKKMLENLPDEEAQYISCKNCGTKVMQDPKRKKKLFCCDKCRNQWWNQHLDQVSRKAYYKIVCKNCRKAVTVYGDCRRKYCSHTCYILDRFGN